MSKLIDTLSKSRIAGFLLLSTLLVNTGCNEFNNEESDDVFFIENKGAIMPVWVRGNTDSGVFVILNHGGPGSSAIFEVHMEAQPGNGQIDHVSPLKILEDSYAMVYWDQRFSGNSQGTADPDAATPDDFGDDMELLIDVLKTRHNVSKLVAIGQSWGHSVGTNYLTRGDNWEHRQSKLDGYIIYKGNISFDMPYQYTKSRMIATADEKISESIDVEFWTKSKEFFESREILETGEDVSKYFEILDEAMDAVISIGQRIGTSVAFTFFSPHNGWFHYANSRNTGTSKFFENLLTDNSLNETAHRIRIPTLMLYGRHDLIAPFEVGEWHLENIETPENQKELIILENSRHGAEGEDIEIFQQEIIDFIDSI